MRVFLVLLLMTLLACQSEKDLVKLELYERIDNYIRISESKASETYHETNIYLVVFYHEYSSNFVKIIENTYYFEKNLDGYIDIGDNKIFFYNSNEDFIKIESLKNGKLKEPNEKSYKAFETFDPSVWDFRIEKDGTLIKVIDETGSFRIGGDIN